MPNRKKALEEQQPPGPQPSTTQSSPASGRYPVAGIGASAGGLEAFTELLQNLPHDTGIALVLIQHLDPKQDSMLMELLSRTTPMPVSQVADLTPIAPNHVYVIPPNANIRIANGVLRLDPRESHNMPIDHFFRSLAEDQGSKAIGVILSGTASDGTLGLKAIKAEGGITFAQDEKTARYDGMPRSAVLAGCVDFILAPEAIARELVRLCRHPYVIPKPSEESSGDVTEQQFGQIFNMLRNATGVDFMYYKHATLRRRILRRMALHKLDRLDQYIERLRRNPAEVNSLFQDILINVTSFFREPSTFDALREKIFPQLLRNRVPSDPVRIWAPGCSTGEEAYSVAICLIEYLREHDLDINIQLFGTDLSEASLEKARVGMYPDSIAADVSAERLRRFFVKVNGTYQISRSIRDMCVFARQNLTKDPPFSKLDLITCRNVLIYLGPVLQAKVLRYFYYGLKPGGYLVLGQSETVGPSGDLFTPVSGKEKIYSRKVGPQGTAVDLAPFEDIRPGAEVRRMEDWKTGSDLLRRVDQLILARHSPAGVVVDEELKVLQFRGHTASYLEHTSGQPSLSLLKMTRGGTALELRKLIQKAKKSGAAVVSDPLKLRSGEDAKPVCISITPVKGAAAGEIVYLILFEESDTPRPPRRPSGDPKQESPGRVAELEEELESTKQYLQTVIEEQEAASEELKSAHEEVQSSNEELQSTNEELLTSKEELQSTNEELNTVNEEMQARNAELTQVNNDLNNLLSSVNIPIVMLGNDLRVRRFTPQAERALSLLPTDVGRKLTDFRLKLNVSDLEALFLDVIDNLHTKEREVQDQDGRTYLMAIRPYRTGDNKIDGAVMTLFDVTDRKQSAEIRYRRLFEASKDGIVVLDGPTGEILDVNASIIRTYGYARGDLLGRHFWETPMFQDSGMQSLAKLADGESIQKSVALRKKSGEPRPVEIVANAYLEFSKLVVQMNIRDASARAHVSQEQSRDDQASRQAEKLDAVGRLAASLAGDFSNLVTTVIGYSDLLKARLGSDEGRQSDLEEIRKAGERGIALARQLLAFGHKKVSQPRQMDPNAVISGAEQVLRVTLPKEVQLEMNLKSTGVIIADPGEIEQVVTTLVLNARDAMPEGGRVTIETSDASDDTVMIAVSDTGTGMGADAQSHLFEPFFTTKPKGQGAGLGLATIYRMVRASGGQMRMSTDPGRGTTFEVLMPRVATAPVKEEIAADALGSGTILLVEDERSIRRLTSTLLRDRGYHVMEAASSQEALRLARAQKDGIDLLLTDVMLPGMSGREVFDRLSGERSGMKVLFMSGHAEDTIIDHGVLDGKFCFLQKPFTPQTLAQKIREALNKEAPR